MRCPRCGCEQEQGLECRQCGLIFERYRRADVRPAGIAVAAPSPWRDLLLGENASSPETFSLVLRALLLAALMLWGLTIMWATHHTLRFNTDRLRCPAPGSRPCMPRRCSARSPMPSWRSDRTERKA